MELVDFPTIFLEGYFGKLLRKEVCVNGLEIQCDTVGIDVLLFFSFSF